MRSDKFDCELNKKVKENKHIEESKNPGFTFSIKLRLNSNIFTIISRTICNWIVSLKFRNF